MPHLSDHTRRDAEHAARSMVRVEVSRYVRRIDELAKTHIAEAIEEAQAKGDAVDGTELGKVAADRAIRTYIGAGEPQPAIEQKAPKS